MRQPTLILSAFCAFWAATIPSTAQPNARPNILWLIAEDLGPELACYGQAQVETPNLDRLATEGVRFTRAYTTAPVCSASRSAFMTGMYQTTIGAHNHRSHRDDGYTLPEGVRVLPDWFRDAGYFTANIQQLPPALGFKGSGKTDWNFNLDHKPFDSNRWDDLKTRQPFYAQINFGHTHRAFKGSRKIADPAKVAIPPYYPDHPVTRQDWANYLDDVSELDLKIGKVLKQLEADGLAENTIVMFFGDHGQAHVRGKQFCYEEGLHIPLIVRVPEKFRSLANVTPGAVEERFVEAIDFGATMLDLAGAKVPAKMQGRVFLGKNAAAPRTMVFGARDRCDETVFRFRSVRDDRYRYIHNFTPDRPFLQKNDYKERQYPVWNLLKQLDQEGKLTPEQKFLTAPTMPAEELYDLQSDPHQVKNLAASTDPQHQAALKRLREAVDRWIEESNDQGRTLEPADLAANEGRTKPPGRKQ